MSIIYKLILWGEGINRSFYTVLDGIQSPEFFETCGVRLRRISGEVLERETRVAGNGEYTVSYEKLNRERTEGMLLKIKAAR